MLLTNTPGFCCHLITESYIQEEERSVDNRYFCSFRFKKVKFIIYIYIHIIFAKKLFNLVICSGEIESLEITSPNISSTLNLVESIISFRLSI